MANAHKYTMAAVGKMFNHYGRQEGDGVERSNKDIQADKTHENYNLAPTRKGIDKDGNEYELSQMEILKKRLSEVKHLDLNKRKDINVMVDWVITLPQDVPREKAEEFFKNAYQFCSERYGEENVILAWVHMDETTPHMHFSFVPVVKDENGSERLCAKEKVSRFELTQFHPKLQEYVEEKMGQSVAVLNGATAGGNLTIIEMKMRKALEKLAEVEATTGALETAQPIIEDALKMMSEITETYRKLDEALKAKKWFGDDDKAKMKALTKEIDEIKTAAETASKTANTLQETLKSLNGNVNEHLTDIFKKMKDMQAAAQKRIKRTERKLERRAERVALKEQNIETEIRQGVQKELAKLDEPIKKKKAEAAALDEEISRKKQELAATDTDFWSSQAYLRTAQAHQQQFTETLQKWSVQNESKNVKSAYPKR